MQQVLAALAKYTSVQDAFAASKGLMSFSQSVG